MIILAAMIVITVGGLAYLMTVAEPVTVTVPEPEPLLPPHP